MAGVYDWQQFCTSSDLSHFFHVQLCTQSGVSAERLPTDGAHDTFAQGSNSFNNCMPHLLSLFMEALDFGQQRRVPLMPAAPPPAALHSHSPCPPPPRCRPLQTPADPVKRSPAARGIQTCRAQGAHAVVRAGPWLPAHAVRCAAKASVMQPRKAGCRAACCRGDLCSSGPEGRNGQRISRRTQSLPRHQSRLGLRLPEDKALAQHRHQVAAILRQPAGPHRCCTRDRSARTRQQARGTLHAPPRPVCQRAPRDRPRTHGC